MFILSGLAFAGLLIVAAVSDIRGYRIPNSICGALVLAFIAFAALGLYRPLAAHLTTFAIAAAIGAGLYFAKLWGGGDAKLLPAMALYIEPQQLSVLLLITALTGGLMATGVLVRRALAGGAGVQDNRIPYGVALATGGLIVFLRGAL